MVAKMESKWVGETVANMAKREFEIMALMLDKQLEDCYKQSCIRNTDITLISQLQTD